MDEPNENKNELNSIHNSEFEMLQRIEQLESRNVWLEKEYEKLKQFQENGKPDFENSVEKYPESGTSFTLSKDGQILNCSHSTLQLLGKLPDQFTGSNFSSLVAQGSRREFDHFLENIFSSGSSQSCNLFLIDNRNFPLPVQISGLMATGADSCLLNVLTIDANKTEFEYSNLNENRYKILTESSNVGIFHTDADGFTTYVNPSWCRITGLSVNDALGDNWLKAVHEDDRNRIRNIWKEVVNIQELSVSEYRFVRPDGEIIWVMGQAIPERNSNNTIEGYVGTITDISERKNAEDALKNNEERYRLLVEHSPEALVVLDVEQQKFINVSVSAVELFKMSHQELLSAGLIGINPDFQPGGKKSSELAGEKILEAVNGGKPSFEWTHCDKYGNLIPCEVRLVRLPAKNRILIRGSITDISERKKAEQLIAKSNERFELISNATNNGLWEWNMESGSLWANEVHQHMYGLTINDAVPDYETWKQKIHPEDRESVVKELEEAIAAKRTSWVNDYRFKKGEDGWMDVYGRTFIEYAKEGKPLRLIGSMIDNSQRKRADEEIKKSNERFLGLLNNLEAGIIVHSKDTSIINSNPKASELLGLTEDQMKGKMAIDPAWKFLDTDNRTLPLEKYPVNRIAISKRSFKNLIIGVNRPSTRDVAWFIVNGFPVFDDSGQIHEIVISFIDITEQKEGEIELKKAKEKAEESISQFRNYVENAPDGVFVADEMGNYLEVNPAASLITGYSKEELLCRSIKDLTPEDSKKFAYQHFNTLLKTGSSKDDLKFIHKSGEIRWWSVEAVKLSECRFLGFVKDITERKKNDQILIDAKNRAEENDRLKSAFLANMSHEIRTPMNGILGFADLLKDPTLTSKDQQEYIGIIQRSGTRMLNIINDIVSISKVEAGQVKLVISKTDINEQLHFIHSFFKPEINRKGIDLIIKSKIPDKEAIIKTDREKVYAILTNLVNNAIKFTEKGSIEFGFIRKGEFLEFFVKDTGAGIPADKKEIIFERFRQGTESLIRNIEGAGLGLSISKAYVEMMGGKIWVESQEGIGSQFYFTIPYQQHHEAATEIKDLTPTNKGEQSIQNLKILIAEDDYISELYLKMTVKMLCREIVIAHNGLEAVAACRNNPDIDLILMDIQMPEMDGYEATKQIRKFNKEVIIIAQTAFELADNRTKALASGCNECISKPIVKASLLAMIEKYLILK